MKLMGINGRKGSVLLKRHVLGQPSLDKVQEEIFGLLCKINIFSLMPSETL